jgi:hypothetical protein
MISGTRSASLVHHETSGVKSFSGTVLSPRWRNKTLSPVGEGGAAVIVISNAQYFHPTTSFEKLVSISK